MKFWGWVIVFVWGLMNFPTLLGWITMPFIVYGASRWLLRQFGLCR